MALHAASRGFQNAPDAYERGRPGYPAAAVAHLVDALGLREGATVLEMGAGTGKLTRLLVPTGARILAVEPIEAMRRALARRVRSATTLAGAAEAIPIASESADAAVVAQAFHWFDGPRALAELRRVLRPGGRLGLVWNVRDESAGWVAELTRIIDAHEGDAPRYRTGRWRDAFALGAGFTTLREQTFRHLHLGAPEQVVERVASISFIAALPEGERRRVLEMVRRLLAEHPETRGLAEIAFPYRTDVFLCARAD